MTMHVVLASPTVAALSFTDSAGDALRSVLTFIPKLVAFLVILLIGWLVAKLLRTAVVKGLHKVRFDRAVERGGIGQALSRSRYDASGLVAQIVYYAILLIALEIGFGVFGPNPVSDLLTRIVSWLPLAIVAIIIVVVAAAIARAVKDLISAALGGVSYGRVLANIASIAIIALGVIAALNQMGIATTVTTPVLIAALATVGGVIVVGVGGGLIRPMQQRWERWLDRAEREVPNATAQAQAYQRGHEDAQRAHEAATATTRTTESVHAESVPAGQGAVPQHSAVPQSGPTGPVQPGTAQPGSAQTGTMPAGPGPMPSGPAQTGPTQPGAPQPGSHLNQPPGYPQQGYPQQGGYPASPGQPPQTPPQNPPTPPTTARPENPTQGYRRPDQSGY
jgi:hypothetical protein